MDVPKNVANVTVLTLDESSQMRMKLVTGNVEEIIVTTDKFKCKVLETCQGEDNLFHEPGALLTL